MRLLNIYTFEFEEFSYENIPPYVVASHRWHKETEITHEDIAKGYNREKDGYKKVQGFAQFIKTHMPEIQWLWIDTCCVRQESDREVNTAVNAMFRWYRNSAICVAYLQDVEPMHDAATVDAFTKHEDFRSWWLSTYFTTSEWFQRGWTLQELLAPQNVIFLDRDWNAIGFKTDPRNLMGLAVLKVPVLQMAATIAGITGIPEAVLHNYAASEHFSNGEKLAWNIGRRTTMEEDIWYCMLGILDVKMAIIYGEGVEHARKRLMETLRIRDLEGFNMNTAISKPLDRTDQPERRVDKLRLLCKLCMRLFKTEVALQQHWVDLPDHRIHRYTKDRETFVSAIIPQQYPQDVYSDVLRYLCPLCPQQCYDEVMLAEHLEQHAEPTSFQLSVDSCDCRNCQMQVALERLKSPRNKDMTQLYECKTCRTSYRFLDELNYHLLHH